MVSHLFFFLLPLISTRMLCISIVVYRSVSAPFYLFQPVVLEVFRVTHRPAYNRQHHEEITMTEVRSHNKDLVIKIEHWMPHMFFSQSIVIMGTSCRNVVKLNCFFNSTVLVKLLNYFQKKIICRLTFAAYYCVLCFHP